MSDGVPVLDADKTVRFAQINTYAEALRAVVAGEWLMAAPKLTLRLQEELSLVLSFESKGLSVKAVAVPFYWRGPFVGMKVRPATPGELSRAKEQLQAIEFTPEDLPATAAAPPDPAPAVADSQAPQADPPGQSPALGDFDEDTSPEAEGVSFPEPGEDGLPAVVEDQPPEDDGVSFPEPGESGLPEVGEDQPPEPHEATGELEAELMGRKRKPRRKKRRREGSGQMAAPAGGELFGTASTAFTIEELLNPFPDKGAGLPLPEEHSIYRVVCCLISNELSGELEVKLGDDTAAVFVRQGTLLGIEPFEGTFDDYFSNELRKESMIEPDKLDEIEAMCQATEEPLAMALYKKRAVGMDVLGKELRRIKQELFSKILEAPSGAGYRFRAKRKFGRKFDPIRLHLAATLVEFIQKLLSTKYVKDLDPLLEPFKFKYAQVKQNDIVPIEALSLTDKQKHAIKNVLNGPNRLNEIYSLCLLTRHGTARLITLLHHFTIIDWLDEPGIVEGQETIETILGRELRKIKTKDHFGRIEVHWGGHPGKLETSLKRFKHKFGPDRPLARSSDEAADLCAAILELVQESFDFLSNKRQRRAYRYETQGEARVRRAAEFLVKQADLVRFRNDWDAAFELLEAALDMNEQASTVSKLRQWRSERPG